MIQNTNLRQEVEEIWTGIEKEIVLPDRVLPDPGLIDCYRFRQERKLFLDSDVDFCAAEICNAVMLYNCEDKGKDLEDREHIFLYVMSQGGQLDEMWSLIDLIRLSVTPIWTVNIGLAASAAALVYLAGEHRLMMPNATIMLHEGSAHMHGDASKVIDTVENYNKELNRMRDFVLTQTSIPEKLFNERRKDDWYLDANECLKLGICHEIVQSLGDII